MILKQINFHNFRNFAKAEFNFNPNLTVILGENAKGKTNLIEGIYFLITGIGFRETKEEELIRFGEDNSYVDGELDKGDVIFNFKIVLKKQTEGCQKEFYIERSKKKHFQYAQEQTKVVLFSPEQIDIIIGAPSLRRDYFDKFISTFDFEYKTHLGNFENGLRRRNKILERYKDISNLKEDLEFWNKYLIEQAKYITEKREQYINFLNLHPKLNNKKLSIKYLKNEFTEVRTNESFQDEIRLRKTLIGPQKDDFQIYLYESDKKNVHTFGSRSEQRMALFWLKLNEINFFEEKFKISPIILLDDVFSELDSHNKKIVLNLVKKYQTVATTTEKEVIEMIETSKTVIQV